MGPVRASTFVMATALFVAACGGAAAPAPTSAAIKVTPDPATTHAALAFHDGMRKLWEDHVTWTRLYLVSAIAGLPDANATAARLLRNQTDIGDAIKPYYGDAAGTKLTGLLTDHIKIATEIVVAAKASDTAKVSDASARWNANMDDIATFLAGANPNAWPLEQLKPMMRMHLELTLAEATDRLGAKWDDDVAAYDRVHAHILGLADQLSAGIVAQFPDRFRD